MKSILGQVADLPEAQVAAALESLCPDPDLRRELQRMLEAANLRPDFMTSLPAPEAACRVLEAMMVAANPPESMENPEPLKAEPPDIPGYRVLHAIGLGGMGVVYAARDSNLGRVVAIKLLSSRTLQSESAKKRLRREARILASLDHPHVVQVHAFGEVDGQAYIVMEYVKGGNLAELIQEHGRLPFHSALEILGQVVQALEAAWRHKIVHRDIKPANILLDGAGSVRVADFGLARSVSDESALGITLSGQVLGSPHYLSPEQARGEVLDLRSDVYSLGIVLYEMVTGQRPFEGASPVAVVEQHLRRNLPRLKSKRPDAPPVFEALVQWMTAKDRAKRPASHGVLLSSVEAARRALRSGRTPLHVRWFAMRTRLSSWRWAAAVAGLLVLGFILGALGGWVPIFKDRIPARVELLDKGLSVFSKEGNYLWSHEFPGYLESYPERSRGGGHYTVPYWRFVDFNHDGRDDLIFIARYKKTADSAELRDEIYFFPHDKKGFVRKSLGRPVKSPKVVSGRYTNDWSVLTVLWLPPEDGEPRVVIGLRHRQYAPELVLLVGANGRILREYDHYGALYRMVLWDADDDGEMELVAGGTSNEFNCPVVVVLELNDFGGASPSAPGKAPWTIPPSPGRERYYIRFPNLKEEKAKRGQVEPLIVDGRTLKAIVQRDFVELIYSFEPRFAYSSAAFSDLTHKSLESKHATDPSFPTPAVLAASYLEGVRFFNGSDWKSSPATVEAPAAAP